jgi:hypothetical protein
MSNARGKAQNLNDSLSMSIADSGIQRRET